MNKKNLWMGGVALLLAATLLVFSQTTSQLPELDKNGKPVLPRPMPHLVYSPADLNHSGVTLPAGVGNATVNSNIVRLGDVTKMTVFVNSHQYQPYCLGGGSYSAGSGKFVRGHRRAFWQCDPGQY